MSDDGVVRMVRCPGCWALPAPEMWFTLPGQAWCANDDCQTIMWDMTGEPGAFKAHAEVLDLSPLTAGVELPELPRPQSASELEAAVLAAAEVAFQPLALAAAHPGSSMARALAELQDANLELALRQHLHSLGYRCASGCGICDPHRPLSDDDELRVRTWARALVISLAVVNPEPTREQLRLLLDPAGGLYGLAGLAAVKAEIATL